MSRKRLGIKVDSAESPEKTSGYQVRVNNWRKGEIRDARYRVGRGTEHHGEIMFSSRAAGRVRARARFLHRTSSPRRSSRIRRGEVQGERGKEERERGGDRGERFSVPG